MTPKIRRTSRIKADCRLCLPRKCQLWRNEPREDQGDPYGED